MFGSSPLRSTFVLIVLPLFMLCSLPLFPSKLRHSSLSHDSHPSQASSSGQTGSVSPSIDAFTSFQVLDHTPSVQPRILAVSEDAAVSLLDFKVVWIVVVGLGTLCSFVVESRIEFLIR